MTNTRATEGLMRRDSTDQRGDRRNCEGCGITEKTPVREEPKRGKSESGVGGGTEEEETGGQGATYMQCWARNPKIIVEQSQSQVIENDCDRTQL